MNRKYEVGLTVIGCTVDVLHEPANITKLRIEYEGQAPCRVREMETGQRAGARPALPEQLNTPLTGTSKLPESAKRRQKHLGAWSMSHRFYT
ncbi:hypothetical protein [Paenibacillus sp. NPDC057934]|uniref:hypothetical protein n=1 Tax=Paenibacillus sp. NPDC057934 TaxID=3346282 RepID=UPI0036D96E3D